MIGRTNAGGGGGQKYLTGSFTSTSGSNQRTFTVAGLDFEPKLLIIQRTNYVNVRNSGEILFNIWKDFEHGICDGVVTSQSSSGTYGSGKSTHYLQTYKTIDLSKSGNITTVTLGSQLQLSGDSFEDAYGTYSYYFYG